MRTIIALGLIAATVAPAPAAALPPGFSRVRVAAGLAEPTAFVFKGAKILVTEKTTGKVQMVQRDGSLRATPYVAVSVSSDGERGLLGIAIDPEFATNKFVYVYYTTGPGAPGYSGSPKNRVSRFTTASGVGTNETIVLDNIPSDNGNHNGGDIHFGFDGMLYITVGDGGVFRGDALSLQSLRGKILRVTRDGRVPPDNPFALDPAVRRCATPGGPPPGHGPCGEIYAYGFRNPFRLSLRAANRSYLTGDVGERTWEELDTVVPGGNYGWPVVEGPCPFLAAAATANCDPQADRALYPLSYQYPILFYGPGTVAESGRTIIAGAFAENGTNYPAPYAGAYFYGDFAAGWIHVLRLDGNNNALGSFIAFATLNSPVAFRNGRDGDIYVLSYRRGKLFRYVYTGP